MVLRKLGAMIGALAWMGLSVSLSANAQVLDSMEVGDTCSYYGEEVPASVATFASSSEAETMISDIMDASGLAPNFEIRSGGVPNAAAVIQGANRVILYNPAFMIQTRQQTGSDWAPVSIMAHEIGHHLNAHTLDNKGSRPNRELEADYFSGFILQRMGATLTEAQVAMNALGDPRGSSTHPAKHDRLAAIATGWAKACEQDSNCTGMQDSTPGGQVSWPTGPSTADTANSCRWANDGECDEPDLCARGTDTNDCTRATPVSGDGANSCRFANDGECDEPDMCAAGTDTADCSSPIANSCDYANDGECDEGIYCPMGTDTNDCAPQRVSGGDRCRWANDGECDEPTLCLEGTDTSDCSGTTRLGANSCRWANDGECDEPDLCDPGTDTADCGGTTVAGDDSCVWANDGECDEPDLCSPGTDTTDCGVVNAGPDSCTWANDGECDEPDLCAPGTDTSDCGGSAPIGGNDSCVWANDGECDEPDLCSPGTDTTDCGGTVLGGADSCTWANDGECDEPDLCAPGTDTSDCSGAPVNGSCQFTNDGQCDEPDLCAPGTDVEDCRD
ncbi:MAG: hypothetical protein MRY64_08845, partial [Hyphomonadaceae bacterium]|nr:hypothetical protein [Hyphomonadaceae bacterium]